MLGPGQPASHRHRRNAQGHNGNEGAGSLPSWRSQPRGGTQTVNKQTDEGRGRGRHSEARPAWWHQSAFQRKCGLN